MKIELTGLDIGEVIVAGLITLGKLPKPQDGNLVKYQVTVEDGQHSLPGFVCPIIPYPKIIIRQK